MLNRKQILFLSDSSSFWLSFALLFTVFWQGFSPIIHLSYFAVIFLISLTINFAMGLYDDKENDWLGPAFISTWTTFGLAVIFIYFISRLNPEVTPRGSLILFFLTFSFLLIILRGLLEKTFLKKIRKKIILIQENQESKISQSIIKEIALFPFEILKFGPEFINDIPLFERTVKEEKIKIIILDSNNYSTSVLKKSLEIGLEILSPEKFIEKYLKRISLERFRPETIAIQENHPFKEITEKVIALIILIISLPIIALTALLIKLLSPGRIFFIQKRIGQKGKEFTVFKLRTMTEDAERSGASWAALNDPRIIKAGRFIRDSHLDELPQLLNILRGEMSFIGPRPEQPEFVKELEKKISFYSLRHLIKPGLSGWAQINYPYGASLEDARNKLEYDLYYLKNQNFLLDLKIALKTLKFLFFNLPR